MNAGLYPSSEVSMGQYLADPCPEPSLSSGAVHQLLTESPAHVYARHPRFGAAEREDSDATDIGSIAHDLLLGGEGKICVIDPQEYRSKPTKENPEGNVPDGWTNKAIRAVRDHAREKGLTPILAGAAVGVRAMRTAALDFVARSEIAGVFDDGESEVTQIWQEVWPGSVGYGRDVWCRARHDWVNHEMKIRLSYKTTKMSANPERFIRSMTAMGYHTALAFYRRGFEALLGVQEGWTDVILLQEQGGCHACSLIGLDPGMWAIAASSVQRGIDIWRKCMATKQWPAYSPQIHYATPTAWQLTEAEESVDG